MLLSKGGQPGPELLVFGGPSDAVLGFQDVVFGVVHDRTTLTAIDFRAGLALLPFLPMCPADLRLILRGLVGGRIVQFDRSDRKRFDRFVEEHEDDFRGLEPAIDELREREGAYRASMPDVTCHHVRLLVDPALRRSIKQGTITSWRNLGRIDDAHARRLGQGRLVFLLLYVISFVPILGKGIVKLWGNGPAREHFRRCLFSFSYLLRAMQGARIETLVDWQRQGRVGDDRVVNLVRRPAR